MQCMTMIKAADAEIDSPDTDIDSPDTETDIDSPLLTVEIATLTRVGEGEAAATKISVLPGAQVDSRIQAYLEKEKERKKDEKTKEAERAKAAAAATAASKTTS